MRLLDRIFPKPDRFLDFAGDPGEPLPGRATPFIWYFVRKLKWSLGLQCLLYTAGSALMAVEPMFFGLMVDAATDSAPGMFWHNALWVIAGYVLFVQVLARIGWQAGHMVQAHVDPILLVLIRYRLAGYLYGHSYRFFQEDFAGRLAGKVIEMPAAIVGIVDEMVEFALHTLVTAAVIMVLFGMIDWRFAAVTGVTVILHGLLGWRFVLPISRTSAVSAAASNKMRGRYIDSISNILLVKLFARRRYEDGLLSQALAESGTAEKDAEWQNVLYMRGQHVLRAVFQTSVIVICAVGYAEGTLTVGEIATALPLCGLFTNTLWWVMKMAPTLFSRLANIQEALDTIIQEQEVRDAPGAGTLVVKTPGLDIESVTFAYGHQQVFRDFSLHIPAFQKVGLVGLSGAGKSTLVQLVLRLFDLQGGKITLDGTDIATVTQDSLRETVSVIPQSTDLLHRSILENIRYGRPEATMDEVVEAAKKAHIHDVILNLKDQHGNTGYEALVGERGVKLSGGQRQRIAITRAFLKNAPVLIMDEPTSALDSESEKLIQQSLAVLMEGRTVIAIAHRLSTILHLDRIVVLKDGRVVEDGRHGELLARNSLYAHLWALQSEGFIGEGGAEV
ncbi:MAG: ABC transporter ATP-binding protein/permease [Pseudomonadota bacterium]|nr:ABC transporter ATP-binding protein/permease [Pseudomonadota bacterium]